MKPRIIVRSSFLSWLRGVWVNAFAPERKPMKTRRERRKCIRCGREFASTTHGGVWKHKCYTEDPEG